MVPTLQGGCPVVYDTDGQDVSTQACGVQEGCAEGRQSNAGEGGQHWPPHTFT